MPSAVGLSDTGARHSSRCAIRGVAMRSRTRALRGWLLGRTPRDLRPASDPPRAEDPSGPRAPPPADRGAPSTPRRLHLPVPAPASTQRSMGSRADRPPWEGALIAQRRGEVFQPNSPNTPRLLHPGAAGAGARGLPPTAGTTADGRGMSGGVPSFSQRPSKPLGMLPSSSVGGLAGPGEGTRSLGAAPHPMPSPVHPMPTSPHPSHPPAGSPRVPPTRGPHPVHANGPTATHPGNRVAPGAEVAAHGTRDSLPAPQHAHDSTPDMQHPPSAVLNSRGGGGVRVEGDDWETAERILAGGSPEYRAYIDKLREDRAAVDRAIPALQAAWDAAGDPRGRRPPGLTGEELAAVIGLTDEAELADPWVQSRLSDPTWPVDPPKNVLCVTDANYEEAAAAVRLMTTKHHRSRVYACDTEVADIDLARQSPVGHGRVICLSVYGGPGLDLSEGRAGVAQDVLWVDLSGERRGEMLAALGRFFGDEGVRKVWHNYGFDRHVLENEGVAVRGFAGDTLHMARLLDTSRASFALDSLTSDATLMPKGFRGKTDMKTLFSRNKVKKDGELGKARWMPGVEALQAGPLTRGRWIEYSAHDAVATWMLRHQLEGSLMDCPAHNDIDACLRDSLFPDTRSLWDVYRAVWMPFGEVLTDMEKEGFLVDREHLRSAMEQAQGHAADATRRFKEWAAVFAPGAARMNVQSTAQLQQLLFGGVGKPPERGRGSPPRPAPSRAFRVDNVWGLVREGQRRPAKTWEVSLECLWGIGPDGEVMLPHCVRPVTFTKGGAPAAGTPVLRGLAGKSGAALRLLKERFPDSVLCRDVDANAPMLGGDEDGEGMGMDGGDGMVVGGSMDGESGEGEGSGEEGVVVEGASASKGGKGGKGRGGRGRKKKGAAESGSEEVGESGGAEGVGSEGGSDSTATVAVGESGGDGVDENALPSRPPLGSGYYALTERERGELAAYARQHGLGKMYEACGGGQLGLEGCAAMDMLCEVSAIETLLSNFIIPLQGDDIATPDRRVHCSLNLNTETGRLSARRPNLQNQPALEKDRYQIRKAFRADTSKGHTLVVADYGQLELRLLAHMAGCESMVEAFRLGGDFHSRTALSMYDHIAKAVEGGEVLLEWDGGESGHDPPPRPLVKDVFASERRRAKILNFSLAYGKTAFGLANDFGVTKEEAEATIQKWYKARREVGEWQERMRSKAKSSGPLGGYVPTMLGRRRRLPDASSSNAKSSGHAMRAAINTPIQGSAADVATACMVKIWRHPRLREMGWKLLLQVHDEVILEGPRETAEEAKAIVVRCMENPFETADVERDWLRVKLAVDCKVADTWYEAK